MLDDCFDDPVDHEVDPDAVAALDVLIGNWMCMVSVYSFPPTFPCAVAVLDIRRECPAPRTHATLRRTVHAVAPHTAVLHVSAGAMGFPPPVMPEPPSVGADVAAKCQFANDASVRGRSFVQFQGLASAADVRAFVRRKSPKLYKHVLAADVVCLFATSVPDVVLMRDMLCRAGVRGVCGLSHALVWAEE